MTHSDSNISNTIASDFSGTVTSSTMASNKWGYSLDNTNFSKIPAANEQATIKNIDHYPSAAEKTNTVRIGMKLDTTLPSGTYSKNVKFSVVAHEAPADPNSMQGFNKSSLNIGDSATLTDSRDGNTYTVKKLADGNVWMTENLRIANKTITPADSDVSSNFTIPASSTSGFSAQETNNAYVDSTYGGYYTFTTATAGTGGSLNILGADASSSICPKGWRLPTSTEFQTLYNHYNSLASMQGDPGFVLSGMVYNGLVDGQGESGHYWSSTTNSSDYAYYLYMDGPTIHPDFSYTKSYGRSIRCIAR